jgi:hypothetical protein
MSQYADVKGNHVGSSGSEGPHIAISHIDAIPAEIFDEFAGMISMNGFNLEIEPRPQSAYAGVEWLIPTAVVVFITKSYFDGFLKEMGKDHYGALKKGLSLLRKRLSPIRVSLVGSGGKASENQTFSYALSIVAEAHTRYRFKFLIQENLPDGGFDVLLDSMIDFLESFHAGRLDSDFGQQLEECRIVGGTILLAFDDKTKKLVLMDPVSKRTPNVA